MLGLFKRRDTTAERLKRLIQRKYCIEIEPQAGATKLTLRRGSFAWWVVATTPKLAVSLALTRAERDRPPDNVKRLNPLAMSRPAADESADAS